MTVTFVVAIIVWTVFRLLCAPIYSSTARNFLKK